MRILLVAVLSLLVPSALLADNPGLNTLVSVASSGALGNEDSGNGIGKQVEVTEDGRFVVFTSFATNLVPGDTNGEKDVFVRDRLAQTTIRASVGHAGQQSNGRCDSVGISADGRFVVFMSEATNLDPLDFNGQRDVFVYDSLTDTSELVSRSISGDSANGNSESPSITADGTLVCFWSAGSNVIGVDNNNAGDIFVWNRLYGTSQRVSTNAFGQESTGASGSPQIASLGRYVAFHAADGNLVFPDNNGHRDVFVKDLFTGGIVTPASSPQLNEESLRPRISANGTTVVFASSASNVVAGDTNGESDVFLWGAFAGGLTRVSVSTAGLQANGDSERPEVSADGLWVAYASSASNLVAGDTNNFQDVFLYGRVYGTTERVSLDASGNQVSGFSFGPDVSEDGRYVAFGGTSEHVPTDTNERIDVYVRDRQVSSNNSGWSYCQSTPNSSGDAGRLRALQSPVVADNDLLFVIEDLPTNQPGYMLMSDTQGFVPFFSGSQGTLCLGAPIIRFNGDVLNTGAGDVDFSPDFMNLPQGTVVSSGEGWNFQFWFRDNNPVSTSNTTDAVCVQLH